MKIHIEIEGDEGEMLFHAECLAIDSAIEKLGQFERQSGAGLTPEDSPI